MLSPPYEYADRFNLGTGQYGRLCDPRDHINAVRRTKICDCVLVDQADRKNGSPLTLELANQITKAMRSARKSGLLPWIRPDTKAQVTVKYRSDEGQIRPLCVTHVVVTLQHDHSLSLRDIRMSIRRHILDSTLPLDLVNDETCYLVSVSIANILGSLTKGTDTAFWQLRNLAFGQICRSDWSQDRG